MRKTLSPGEKTIADALVKGYGTQCEPHMDVLLEKICLVVAAHLYAGSGGVGNPLVEANQALEKTLRDLRSRR